MEEFVLLIGQNEHGSGHYKESILKKGLEILPNLCLEVATPIQVLTIAKTFNFWNNFNSKNINYGNPFLVLNIPINQISENMVIALKLSDLDINVLLYGRDAPKNIHYKMDSDFFTVRAIFGVEPTDNIDYENYSSQQIETVYNPLSAAVLINQDPFNIPVNEEESAIVRQGLLKQLEKFNGEKNDFEFIVSSLKDFVNLGNISFDNQLKVIGLFAIIENLLTNEKINPHSITHQIKNKIPLLNNRFSDKIDIKDWFETKNDEVIILDKLYKYRSIIAHGNKLISFKDPEFKDLKNHKVALTFLYILTKKLLRHSIIEPQLFKDLRKC